MINNPHIIVSPEFPIVPETFIGLVVGALRANGLHRESVGFARQVGDARYLDQVIEAAQRVVYIEMMP